MRTRERKWEDGGSTRYLHSAGDRLERVEDYDRDGQLTMACDYRYDDRGRNIERIVRDGAGKQIRRLTFESSDSVKGLIHREYGENDELLFTRTIDNEDA